MATRINKSISFDPETWERVEAAANRHNQTVSALVRDLCWDHLLPADHQSLGILADLFRTPSKRREAIKHLSELENDHLAEPTPS